MLKPGAAAPPPGARLAEVDSTGRREAANWPTAPSSPKGWPCGTKLPTLYALGHQSVLGQAREEKVTRAGSGQSVKVHSGQWLAPVAEVAVFRVGQMCAGATGHRWKQELNHLAEPLVSMGGTGPALSHQAETAPCLGALGKEESPWWGCGTGAQEEAGAWGRMWQGVQDTWQGLASRGFVILHGLLDEFSPGVDCEDARFR